MRNNSVGIVSSQAPSSTFVDTMCETTDWEILLYTYFLKHISNNFHSERKGEKKKKIAFFFMLHIKSEKYIFKKLKVKCTIYLYCV